VFGGLDFVDLRSDTAATTTLVPMAGIDIVWSS
jgi:hypothetical protein